MFENYYLILGIDKTASEEDIKRAYREMAKKYHPDKHRGDIQYEEKFKRILEAYETLIDPVKRARFDDILHYRDMDKGFSFTNRHPSYSTTQRPNYSAPKYNYKREKVHYNPTVKMYGKLFIIGLISFVILVPIGLLRYASIVYYEDALIWEESGQYMEAANLYKKAISIWSGRNIEATIGYSSIYIYHLTNYGEARQYLNPAFRYTRNDSIKGILHYLRGLTYYGNNSVNDAIKDFDMAESYNYNMDSILRQRAKIYAYDKFKFREAIDIYKDFLSRDKFIEDSYFGMGWAHQNLGEFSISGQYFDSLLTVSPDNGLALYYKGLSLLYQKDTLNACYFFSNASKFDFITAQTAYKKYCLDSANKAIFTFN